MTEKKSSDATRDTSRKVDANFLSPIGNFFREHPAIAVSLLYFELTTFGVVYAWQLFRRFDLNFFDYAETSDFLLAAFKDPMVLLITMIALFFIISFSIFIVSRGVSAHEERQKLRRLQVSAVEEKTRDPSRAHSGALVAFSLLALFPVLFYTLYAPFSLANGRADELLGPTYEPLTTVQYRATASSKEQTRETGLRVIGTTQSFVFFYDRKDTRTLVIPTAQIVEMEHDGPKGEPKDNQ